MVGLSSGGLPRLHLTVYKPLLRLLFSGGFVRLSAGLKLLVKPLGALATMLRVHNPIRRWAFQIVSGAAALLALSGCMTGQSLPGEEHELPSLRVVFLDGPQMQAKWQEITGKSAVMMTPRLVLDTHRRKEVVVGFYDFRTRTIYCPKMDFEVCGHELHHAVLGQFHLQQ